MRTFPGLKYSYAFLIILAAFSSQSAYSQSITIQGRLSDSAGTPITGGDVIFQVQILAADGSDCVLYDETQHVSMVGSNGLFSVNLNASGTVRNAPLTYTLEQTLSNARSFSVNTSYCKSGTTPSPYLYTPGTSENRKVVLRFKDSGNMQNFETIPAMDLNPVPYAMEARSVGGFPASSILRVGTGTSPGNAPALSAGDFTELRSLIDGLSAKYMGTSPSTGAKLPAVSGTPPAGSSAGSIWFDSSGSGSIKFKDASGSVQTVGTGAGSGTITGITAGVGLSGGGSSGTVSLALTPSGVGADGTIGSASSIPEIQYDTYGRIKAVTPRPITGLLPAAGTNHQALISDGAAWTASFIGLADLRKDASTPLFPGSCAANETLRWSSVTGVFACESIEGITFAQLADALAVSPGTYKSVTVNKQGQVTNASNPTTLAGFGIADGVANGGAVPKISSGNETPSLPASGLDGELFVAVDTQKIYRYQSSAPVGWRAISSANGSGGTLTDVLVNAGLTVAGSGATRTIGLDNSGTAAVTNATKVSTDASGRVTAGGSLLDSDIPALPWSKIGSGKPTSLGGYGITDALDKNGGVPLFTAGSTAGRPATSSTGALYVDTQALTLYRYNGTSWDIIGTAGAGGSLTGITATAGLTGGGSSGNVSVGLSTAGVAAVTNATKVSTDAYGRVTSGGSLVDSDIPSLPWSKIGSGKPTTLAGYEISDAVSNAGNAVSFQAGLATARPANPPAGSFYVATDTKVISYYTTAWNNIASDGSFSGSLSGDVTGTQGATSVAQVNGVSAANVALGANAANAATDANTAATIMKRDSGNSFSAGAAKLASLVLRDSGSNTATIQAPTTVPSSYTLRLPTALGSANQVLTTDASGNLSWTSPAVTSGVTVTAPLTNSGSAAAPNLGIQTASGSQPGALSAADWTSFSGKLGSALNSAMIWVGNASNVATPVTPSGDVALTNSGAFTVNGIKGQSISAVGASAGQVLRYAGANTWTPSFVGIRDLRSNVTGTTALSATCTSSQTLTWDSAADNLTCQNISISAASQLSGVLPVANGGTGVSTTNAGLVFAGPTTGSAAPAFRALAASDLPAEAKYWTSATGGINYAGGNVGVGTTAPGTILDLAGQSVLVRGTGATPGEIRLAPGPTTGTNYVGFRAPASNPATSTLWALPAADGTNGQFLSTDGSGRLSWATASSAVTPAGSATQVQFNNAGSLGASSEFVWDNTNGRLGIGSAAAAGKLHIYGPNTSASDRSTSVSNAAAFFQTNKTGTLWGLAVGSLDTSSAFRPYLQGANASGATAKDIVFQPFGGSLGIGTTVPNTGNRLDVQGGAIASGAQGTAAGQGGEHRFYELAANGSEYVGFRSPDSVAATKIWTLPAADGTSGQILSTNGAGDLSWATASSGANPAGTGSEIQFRSGATAFGANSNFTWDNTSGRLSVGATTTNVTYSSAKLYVAGDNIKVDSNRGYYWEGAYPTNITGASGSGTSGFVDIIPGNNFAMRIRGDGNVGIGTTAPGAPLDVKGAIRLSGATSGYAGFQPAAAAGSTVWTLPTADGSSGQVLSTNGSGILSWVTAASSAVTDVLAGSGIAVSTSGNTRTVSLAAPGAAVNTYRSVSVDSNGRVTAGTNPTTVTGYGLTDAVVNGGQAGAVSVGSNDASALTLKTNNATKVTLTSGSQMEVRAQIRSVNSSGNSYDNTAASVDWDRGNTQSMSVACTTTAFTNMLDGGVYTLAVTETTPTTCTFSQSGLTFYYNPVNQNRANGMRTIYTFQRIGTAVYVSWIMGFQP